MTEYSPSTEVTDLVGSTVHYNGVVGTAAVSIPSSAQKVISEFSISCPSSAGPTVVLYISLDGGTTFKTIPAGGNWSWSPKGYKKQVQVKSGKAGTPYEIVMNFEEY